MSGEVVVSFVVPTRNSVRTIRACLNSIRGQAGQSIELIVVDNHSTDGTMEQAEALADRVIVAGPERSVQRNLGASASRGRLVVFIDSDMTLHPDVASQVVDEFDKHPDIGGLVLPEVSFGSGFWAKCKVLEKQLYLGDGTVEAARALRRDAFDQVGGYDAGLTGQEDWDLPDRLRREGWGIGRIEATVHHDEGRLSLAETFRKKRYYGRTMLPYISRSVTVGARRTGRLALFRRPLRFATAPFVSFGLLGLKAVELTGVAVGMVDGCRGARVESRPSDVTLHQVRDAEPGGEHPDGI
ncbi:MAG: glycosyltransferase family 2 protein [Acidimicrobiales bacterium]